ncbi:MAG TPA: SDR family oxidoreductase [Streptosporangiaceae bacterium]|nr:SDR family oxidoreductase [Streptosporangiaceae bacterium]
MILLAGGTGRLGTALTARLTGHGLTVRVLTRDPARAGHLSAQGVEVVTGDVRDRATLTPAIRGAGMVVSAVHGLAGRGGVSPATVDYQGNINLIDAATAAGAELVLMSVAGAAADSPMELFRMKHAAEEHLKASGVRWTIVRATAFLELWLDVLAKTAARSGRPVVFGHGNNPVNFVSVTDVAALVEHALTHPATRGRILEIGGPDNLTLNQLAAAIQAAAGRTSTPRHLPTLALRLMAATAGRVKPGLGRQARAALHMDQADLTHDTAGIRQAYPGLPCTPLSTCLQS